MARARWTFPLVWLTALSCSSGGGATHDAGPPKDAGTDEGAPGPACGAGGQSCCVARKCNAGLTCLQGFCGVPLADAGDSGEACPFVRCGGVCTDTMSDAMNCGSCGHDCEGTLCASGLCLAREIAVGVAPVHLAVDATDVYFTDIDGTVNKAPSGGGTVVRLASAPDPDGVAIDATHVYFTSQGTLAKGFADGAVYSASLAGGDGGAGTPIATARPRPQAIAVDGQHVYWLEPGGTDSGALLECPLAGCPGNSPVVLYGKLALPAGIALDDTRVFVTTSAGGQVIAFDKATRTPTVLVDMQNEPAGITVQGGKVYFATTSDGLVQSIPVGGGSTAFIATTMGLPVAVAADAVNVYWNDQNPSPVTTLGPVDSCVLAGCPPATPVTLVGNDETASDIAIDAKFVYWIGMSGAILRVAK